MPTPARRLADRQTRTRRYDPELLAARSSLPVVPLDDLEGQRATTSAEFAHFARSSDERVHIADEYTGERSLRLRVYQPAGRPKGGLLWIHGGAFVLGSPEIDDDICRDIAEVHGLVVASPDYRLAPERPWPAAEQDCAAALAWLRRRMVQHGIHRSPAVGGASAGGALALRTALDEVDQARSLDRLVLAYPVVDAGQSSASMARYRQAPVFDGEQADLMWRRYLPEGSGIGWRGPLDDDALAALPPTLVLTTEHDPLRDEGLRLVMELLAAGVSVESLHQAGTFHAFDRFVPQSAAAQRFRAAVSDFLGRSLPVAADW